MTSAAPVHVDGLAVYRRGAHDGAPGVLFVHGSMDRAAGFLRAARRLRAERLTLYDRRGYGRSVDAGTAGTIDELVADLLEVLDAGGASVVVGHSLGAVVALAAAARAPDRIRAVGAFEPPLAWRPWWPAHSAGGRAREVAGAGPGAAAEQFLRRILGDEAWEALPDATKARRRREGPALLADLAAVRAGPPFDPASLTCPVVVGYGTATEARHRRACEELAGELHDVEVVAVEGAPHGAPSTHPDAFASFVRRAAARAARDRP